MAFDPISAVLDIGGKVIDRLWPDPTQRDQAKLELVKMQQSGELAQMANELDGFKAEVSDRDSARQREINVKDSMPAILASGITIGYFAVLGWMLVHGVPKDESGGVLMMMFGSLSTAWGGCISYYFGTTRSSAVKNQIIASKL